MFPAWCRWFLFAGLLLWIVPGVLGHGGFGCTRDDPQVPDVPTDPGPNALSSSAPSDAASPFPALAALLPAGAFVGLAVLGRMRET